MSDQYAITQLTESGGFLRRIRINDGPWFVRIGEESDLARLTRENDELREALGAVQWNGHDRFRCVECRGQPSSGHAPNCRVGQALNTEKDTG